MDPPTLNYIQVGLVIAGMGILVGVLTLATVRKPAYRRFYHIFVVTIILYLLSQLAELYYTETLNALFQLLAAMTWLFAVRVHDRALHKEARDGT